MLNYPLDHSNLKKTYPRIRAPRVRTDQHDPLHKLPPCSLHTDILRDIRRRRIGIHDEADDARLGLVERFEHSRRRGTCRQEAKEDRVDGGKDVDGRFDCGGGWGGEEGQEGGEGCLGHWELVVVRGGKGGEVECEHARARVRSAAT